MQETFFKANKRRDLLYQIGIVAIIITGITLRASKYLPGWSVRGDELAVTLNLLNRSVLELMTKPLGYEQAAPIGFLFTVKTLVNVFGSSEYILRMVAFLAGCVSLLLMYALLRKTSGPYGALFSLLAFTFSYYLVYYASELKQYSSDVLVTLLLALFFHRHISTETHASDFWQLGIIGLLAIGFSHPAIFVLIAIGLALLVHYWKNARKRIWIILVGVSWACTFLALYFMLLRYQTTSTYLITFWGDLNSYMPLRFWRNISWFTDSVGHLFSNIGGFSMGIPFILIPLYMYGLWRFWKEQRWQWIIVASLPIGINMIVSGFQKYPFHGRLIMYLLPLVFIVFAKAIDGLTALVNNRVAANLVFLSLLILLLRPAVSTGSEFLFSKSYLKDDLKPVLAFMNENAQRGDSAYLYHDATSQFTYYAPQYGLERLPVFYGHDYSRNGKQYLDELSLLPRGQRIWFVFTFVGQAKINKDNKQNEREYILDYLNNHGLLLSEFYSENDASSAHLYILK